MKKFRPYKAGFIVLYVLAFLCLGDAVYSAIRQVTYKAVEGAAQDPMMGFGMFSYLIAILALFYVKMYAGTRIAIDDKTMQIVFPVYIKPAAGAKRASFIYRQGENDLKVVNKKFNLADIEKFGYIEDLGYKKLDNSGAKEDNALFPVHEVALVMKDGKRYHVNAGHYSVKQLKEIVALIEKGSGVKAEGKLSDVEKAEADRIAAKKAAKANKGKNTKGKKK
ncbi:MAG: hypothetical protein IJA26_03095 [Clostridia bacterium]|nr:hypothetical protein [Clostridia bacterium]